MQVTDVKSEGLKREYKVKVGAAAINEAVESQLQGMSSRVKIPGFRPGHIPMNVLKQRYGKTVIGEVVERQVNQGSQQVMKDKGLRPALPAKIEITSYEEEGDLEFTMSVEVLPDVPEIDFSKVTLEKFKAEAEEKDIKEGIERLAERNKKLERKGKGEKAKSGDVLVIDFVGKIDGVAFDGGSAKAARLEIDSKHFIPGFEEQLIGAKEGDDVLVKVSFPKEYHNNELAGKPAEFEVKVHEINITVAPKLDDEFAKSVGFETFAKLEEAVRKQFEDDYAQMARTRMKKQLFDYLEDNVRFDVPEGMLELEFNSIWERIQEAKKEGDEELAGKTDDELREEYNRIAERRVRLGLILSDVGFKNKITVTKEELSEALMKQARMFPGQEMKIYEYYQKNPQQLEDLRGPILEEKAVDLVISKATIKDKKVSVGELMAPDEKDEKSTDKKTKRKKAANE
jgi:trigger factor